jgi:hypothetical protein
MLRRRLKYLRFELRLANSEEKISFMCIYTLFIAVNLDRIVGKGIHSQNHMAKLKPEIERLCQQHGFKYLVEENEGRILVKFGDGPGQISHGDAQNIWDNRYNTMPSYPEASHQQPQGYYQTPQPSYQQPPPPQEQFQQAPPQGNQTNGVVEEIVKEAAPVIIKQLKGCCIIL